MKNRNLLIAIAIILCGILAVSVVRMQQEEKPANPIERVSNAVGEAAEEVGDEIDDHTSNGKIK